MHRPDGPTSSTRIILLALLALASVSRPRATEAAAVTYTTTGQVWPWTEGNGAASAIIGPNVIAFQGVTRGTFLTPGAFRLGTFVVAPEPNGSSTIYENAAFSIWLQTSLGGTIAPSATLSPYSTVELDGVLNGTVSSNGQSTVVATIDAITPSPPISASAGSVYTSVLDLPFPLASLSVVQPIVLASALRGGETALLGRITTVAEPTGLAVSTAALAGTAWIRRPRSGRRRGRPVVPRSITRIRIGRNTCC
jgi:hypothetical protein